VVRPKLLAKITLIRSIKVVLKATTKSGMATENVAVELSVEGPFPGDSATTKHGMPEGGFYGACIKAMNNESENFQLTSVTGLTSVATTVWFRSGVPPETRRIARTKGPKTPLKPLSTLLYDVDATISAEPTEKFPRSERYRLAFKIVECGLFLSGTSWLQISKTEARASNDPDQMWNKPAAFS